MKYGDLTLGQTEAIVNKLGGMQGVNDFLSGKTVVHVVEQVLEVWKTIQIGTDSKTVEDFCQDISGVGGKVSDWAKDIMGKSDFAKSISQSFMELDVCVATTEEILGKKGKRGTLSEIYAGIVRMGGELLPAEVGPQLRFQYTDQPNGEWLLMAMEPIKDSDGDLNVFYMKRDDDDLWLHTDYVNPDCVWRSGSRWVFARPRCK